MLMWTKIGKRLVELNMSTRREVLPHAEQLHAGGLRGGQEMAAWEFDLDGWGSHGLAGVEGEAREQQAWGGVCPGGR